MRNDEVSDKGVLPDRICFIKLRFVIISLSASVDQRCVYQRLGGLLNLNFGLFEIVICVSEHAKF